MKSENMVIWDSVSKTDPAYTKSSNVGGRQSTSINTNYMIMQATKALGPVGEGWGFEIIEERFDKSQPIMIAGNPMIIDGETVWMLDHTIRLRLWHGCKEDTIEQFGHTPYRYYSAKNKRIVIDQEYAKKTLSDAIKKCLSLLGVCADIFLGEFDDFNYRQEVSAEIESKKASEKGEDTLAAISEIRGKITNSIDKMKSSKTWNEAEKIYGGAVNELILRGPILGMNVDREREDIDVTYHEVNSKLGGKK